MTTPRFIFPLLLALAAAPAAANAQGCLTPVEQRAAIGAGQAIPLAQASRNLAPEHRGEVVNARLCRANGELVYLLTVVNRHGKVARARIEAATGRVVQVR